MFFKFAAYEMWPAAGDSMIKGPLGFPYSGENGRQCHAGGPTC